MDISACAYGETGVRPNAYIHDLIMAAFVGPKPYKWQVNHKDGDKANPALSNLEYVTHGDNVRHAHATGLMPKRFIIPTETVAELRKRIANGERVAAVAADLGISVRHAFLIRNGEQRQHG